MPLSKFFRFVIKYLSVRFLANCYDTTTLIPRIKVEMEL